MITQNIKDKLKQIGILIKEFFLVGISPPSQETLKQEIKKANEQPNAEDIKDKLKEIVSTIELLKQQTYIIKCKQESQEIKERIKEYEEV